MANKNYKAKLTKVVDLTPSVRELYFTPDRPMEFKAGQFVMINLFDEAKGKKCQRAYSISSSAHNVNDFKLIIKFYEFGVASKWVQTLKGGEEITYMGAFGDYFFREPPKENVVFVATSTGLAPFYSMLTSTCEKYKNVNYHVLMGVWNEKEIFYKNEIEALRSKLPHLKVDYVLDTPLDPNYHGLKGRVTDVIDKMDLTKPTEFYLCGNPAMLRAVKELLASKQFPAAQIYSESYG